MESDSDSDDYDDFLESLKVVLVACKAMVEYYRASLQLIASTSIPPPITPRRAPDVRSYHRMQKRLNGDAEHFRQCYRMYPDVFRKLCSILREKMGVEDTRYSCVEGMLGIFMEVVGANIRYCQIRKNYHISHGQASKSFNQILNALLNLANDWMVQPSAVISPKIKGDERFDPYFKDCLGALDGTHIHAQVKKADAARYRNRHAYTSQNVLAVCNFDMEFIYVNAGWEGSAHDSRVLNNAIERKAFQVPKGKYYLVDCGYANRRSFLAPYRGVRYHLQEFKDHGDVSNKPQDARELFNLRHASLRNVIERIFGVFKSRFVIFKCAPPFKVDRQTNMVLACVGLHNFLRKECRSDVFLPPPNEEEEDGPGLTYDQNDEVIQTQDQQRDEAVNWRDTLANEMWNDVQQAEA